MKIIIFFIAISIVIVSCYDGTLVDSGRGYSNLKIKVFNKDNSNASNAKVTIYMFDGPVILNDSTNSNGEISTNLLEGEYSIITKIDDGLIYYSASDYIQMIGGLNRFREFRPYNNIGVMPLEILNKDEQPIPDINVALLSDRIYNKENPFNGFSPYIYVSGKTDGDGRIIFINIPIDYHFNLIIFRNDTSFYSPNSHYSSHSNKFYYFTKVYCDYY